MLRRPTHAPFRTASRQPVPGRKSCSLRTEPLEDRSVPAASFVTNEVLVQFQTGVDDAGLSAARAAVGGQLVEDLTDATTGGPLELLTLPAGETVDAAVHSLQLLPVVRYAEPNWVLSDQSVAAPSDPYYSAGSLWGMEGPATSPANQYGSNAAAAWAVGAVGSQGVYVGVIDEGIDYRHPDLYQNIWINRGEIPGFVNVPALDLNHDGQLSFRELNDPADAGRLLTDGHIRDINGNGYIDAGDLLAPVASGGWADGIDEDGNGHADDISGWDFNGNDRITYDGPATDDHGTHVAGMIGAVGDNGLGVAGVNWNVTLISAKFLGPNGGTTAGAVKALDYITGLKLHQGLNVVATNNSWGGGSYSRALQEAIIRAANADILFVAAAGNDGDTAGSGNNDLIDNFPPNYDSTVGTPTVPGAGYDNVISVAALTRGGNLATFSNYGPTTVDLAAPGQGIYSTVPDGGFASYSGTSMATPHVTGAAALYAATHPGASARDIKDALLLSATPTPSLAGLVATGGRLNVAAALQVVPAPAGTSPDRSTPARGGPGRTLVVGGAADGSAVIYAPDSAGRYSPAESRVVPFAGVTGDVRTAAADVNGDGIEDTIYVTGPGTPIRVAVISGADDATFLVAPFDPFGGDFTGGGFVAAGNLGGTGGAEFIVTPDRGGGPRVTVFSLLNGTATVRADFFGIGDPNFRGGARVAAGDANRDGVPDLVVAAGYGGGPRVAVYDGRSILSGTPAKLTGDFFAFDNALRNGVFVAVGDLNGDGAGDLIFGAGPGGSPRVLGISGRMLLDSGATAAIANPLANFFVAGNDSDRGGARVATKDADGDDRADLVIGSGGDEFSRVRVYPGKNFSGPGEPAAFQDIDPFARVLADGVFVG